MPSMFLNIFFRQRTFIYKLAPQFWFFLFCLLKSRFFRNPKYTHVERPDPKGLSTF
jgi:hypothetical protein